MSLNIHIMRKNWLPTWRVEEVSHVSGTIKIWMNLGGLETHSKREVIFKYHKVINRMLGAFLPGQFVIDDSPLRHFISSELPPLNHPPSSSSSASPPNSSFVTIFFSQMIDISVAIILKFKLRMRKKMP